ncbi:conserved exported protein of unknown function [Tenacibaculum sp. 190524A02b]|uniref:ExbD/TolR family protein n=1 Tax=Tenacibaculum vairaonense TaxID=3137860 RepID=UPI0032B150D3
MKKTLFFIIILLFNNLCFAQKQTIVLPNDNEFNIDFNQVTYFISIYIDKNGNTYIENQEASIKQIGIILFREKLKQPFKFRNSMQVHILADINTDFSFVDSLKTQISSAGINSVIYRTNSIEDITSGLRLKNVKSLNYLKEPIKESNSEQEEVFEEIIELSVSPIIQLHEDLYNQKFEKVQSSLSNFRYKVVEILDNNKLKIDGNVYTTNDNVKFKEIIESLDVYFLKCNKNIDYKDYFNAIAFIIKTYRKEKVDIPFIEISEELQKSLDKQNFKLKKD